MTLISLVFTLVVVGVVLWAIHQFAPINPQIKLLIKVVVVLVMLWYCLDAFGLFDPGVGPTVPRVGR